MKGQRSQGWVSQNCLWEAAFGEVWDTEVLSGGADVQDLCCGPEQGAVDEKARELLGALYRSGQTAGQTFLGEEEFRLPQKRGVPVQGSFQRTDLKMYISTNVDITAKKCLSPVRH